MNNMIYSRAFWILFSKSFKRQIATRFDIIFAKTVMRCAKANYYTVLSNISSIGKHNPKLVDILFAAFVAAIYKAGDGKISIAQIDSIMTDGLESVSLFSKSFEKNDNFSKIWQDKRHI